MKLQVNRDSIKKLDSHIGIYIFKEKNKPTYVGKSVNIKARLLSHLENAKIHPKERRLIDTADEIETIQTDSEFKALLLEAELIKTYRPKYNVRWKDDKSYLYIKVSVKENYPKISLSRKERDGKSRYFGPFSSTQNVYEILREIRKIFPFCMQNKIGRLPCFYSKIGLCNPCPSFIENSKNPEEHVKLKREYRRNIRLVMKLLEGKIEVLQSSLYKRLKTLTKEEDYEKAIQIRNLILRLESLATRRHFNPFDSTTYNQGKSNIKELLALLRPHFPNLTEISRIEAYDISDLGKKHATASMVVFSDGQPSKSNYRKFRIRNLKLQSDFEMIDEVLKRRFKNDWPLPELLVVDGGRPQVRVLLKALISMNLQLPVIGIAKNPDRIIMGVDDLPTIKPKTNNQGFNLIRHMRDEAHRFARKYHLHLREKGAFF